MVPAKTCDYGCSVNQTVLKKKSTIFDVLFKQKSEICIYKEIPCYHGFCIKLCKTVQ